jgi:hypothetical protein
MDLVHRHKSHKCHTHRLRQVDTRQDPVVILVNPAVIMDSPVVTSSHHILLSYQNENQHLNREHHTHLRPNHQLGIILIICLTGINHNRHRLHRLL